MRGGGTEGGRGGEDQEPLQLRRPSGGRKGGEGGQEGRDGDRDWTYLRL